MGYFPRKINRARARDELRELADRADARAWELIPSAPPSRARYVRFAALDPHEVTGCRRGIFSAAHDAIGDGGLDAELDARLRAELRWFDWHLDSPDDVDRRAVFFFKSSATECMAHVWSLLHALRDAGVWVEMQTFENPGRVEYEDEHQIAAVPWADVARL